MSRIGSKDTKPELAVRKLLFHDGYRYRKNYYGLPGRPDLVLHKYKSVIFINGCYWHACDCGLFKVPKNNRPFWLKKFAENIERDARNTDKLIKMGWRVAVVWECALRQSSRNYDATLVADVLKDWLLSNSREIEIKKDQIYKEIKNKNN